MMTPFDAFLLSMAGMLILGFGVTYAIYRQKRSQR